MISENFKEILDNFEKISEINPDLIIISGRQAESYDELSKIGPTIFLGVDTNDYLNSFTKNMETLGEIFEQEEFIQWQNELINTLKIPMAAGFKITHGENKITLPYGVKVLFDADNSIVNVNEEYMS